MIQSAYLTAGKRYTCARRLIVHAGHAFIAELSAHIATTSAHS
jgi:acyl-CoA reductase-like NAD-dependent aldehyde dehydrogenase